VASRQRLASDAPTTPAGLPGHLSRPATVPGAAAAWSSRWPPPPGPPTAQPTAPPTALR